MLPSPPVGVTDSISPLAPADVAFLVQLALRCPLRRSAPRTRTLYSLEIADARLVRAAASAPSVTKISRPPSRGGNGLTGIQRWPPTFGSRSIELGASPASGPHAFLRRAVIGDRRVRLVRAAAEAQAPAVEPHVVALADGLPGRRRLAVDADAPGDDPGLDLAARPDSAGGEDFLDSFTHGGCRRGGAAPAQLAASASFAAGSPAGAACTVAGSVELELDADVVHVARAASDGNSSRLRRLK